MSDNCFTGHVDAAGKGLVTIVVDHGHTPPIREGDVVAVYWRRNKDDQSGHEHDWRFYGRRPDHLADIICVAQGHDINSVIHAAPMIVNNELLPKYEGQFDVPRE